MVSLNNVSLQDKIDLIWKPEHTSSKQSSQNTIHSKVNQFCSVRSLALWEFEIVWVWITKKQNASQF